MRKIVSFELGRIIEVPVQVGQKVKKGESVMIMESMKMQVLTSHVAK